MLPNALIVDLVFQNSLNSVQDEDTLEVHIEIKSNWGHAMRLGLTEIQLFDGNNALLQIAPIDVTVYGAEECRGSIDVLFNGKCKVSVCKYTIRQTTKKRENTWCEIL